MEREFQSQAEISSKSRVDGYDDFIFVNRYGDVQNQGNLNKALRRMMRDCNDEILEKYGADSDPVLLPQFSCHILRHTFATRLCESGANLKFIQSILGHADVSMTMNIYVDVTDALKKKEMAKPGFRDGRPLKFTALQLEHALGLLSEYSYKQVEAMTGISRSTLQRAKKKVEVQQ